MSPSVSKQPHRIVNGEHLQKTLATTTTTTAVAAIKNGDAAAPSSTCTNGTAHGAGAGAGAHAHGAALHEGYTNEIWMTWLVRRLSLPVSLILENTGSVARDHLANERTWLAYVRTSLSIASTGVALVQLFTISESMKRTENLSGSGISLRKLARPLGATTVLLALCILGIGVFRFFRIQQAMAQGLFPTARSTVIFITAVLAALVAVTFGVLVALPS